MPKLIRITTVPMALKYLLHGQMKYMREHGFDVLMISADGKERLEVIENENCPHIIVPLTRKITPVADLKCLYQLIRIFKKEKPDIVHTHTPKAGLLGMIAAKIAGVKIRIHTVAGLPMMVEKGFKFLLLKNVERLTYHCATQVWPNSFSLLKYIGEQKICRSKKIKVISKGSSNGIDLKRFDKNNLDPAILQNVKNSIPYDPDNFYLLTIGRLVKDKGITELTNAFTKFKSKGNFEKVKLILVGKFEEDLDPLPENILTEIISNKDIIHIEWTPYVEYYISIANLFIFPSHREGFPNVLLQSGALELPIICSEIAGNVDLIENNVSGRLFFVNDVTTIIENIEFAIGQPFKMKIMSQLLYKNIITFYKKENIWDAIHKEYSKLLLK
ncbi:MAG: glycosyltransferase family 4 protein [Ferruginibacter sp.]